MTDIQLELPYDPLPAETPSASSVAQGQAPDHLRSLYMVAKVLTAFASVERTFPAVLQLLRRALPIRTAVLLLEGPRLGTYVWKGEGVSAERLQRAKARAQKSYGYLGGCAGRLEDTGVPITNDAPSSKSTSGGTFLVLPLALSTRPVFGVVLVECVAVPGELDLAFVSAVVNQLAVALDRYERIEAQQAMAEARRVASEELRAAAEAREKQQRFLAEAGAFLASSLDAAPLQALVELAVPWWGEVCLVDVRLEDGATRRSIAVSDPEKYAQIGAIDLVRSPVTSQTDASAHPRSGSLLRAAGLESLLVVPLRARGHDLGTLAFLSTQPSRYASSDVAFLEDVAQRVAMALDNRRLYEQARSAVQARENLLAVVSHDLKNPLSVIFMVLASALPDPANGERRLKGSRGLDIINRAASRMSSLVTDILDTESMSVGHLVIHPDEVSAAQLVSDAVDDAGPLAAKKSLSIESEIRGVLPSVSVDETRIQQVFANLLGNAIKFAPAHGKITVVARGSASAVTFSITDDGPGIAEADRARLFDRFWQAPSTASLGTGLGLFIARSVVEAHGGTIWVDSEPGAGSTFSFQVPTHSRRSGMRERVHAA